jgi:hypothetical protein
MTMIRPQVALLSLALLPTAIGCATAPPPAPSNVTMNCQYPVLSPMPETKESQTKGGVGVTVAITPFQCAQQVRKTYTQKPPTVSEKMLNPHAHGHTQTTSTPYLQVVPERLKVTVRVSNQLSRVFRGAGTVIQFQIAGKTYASKQEDFAEFTNVIIPPRGEQLVELYGPPVESLPPQANIGIFLYDVVTKTDVAGNITEKQNFEWFYNYSMQTKQEMGQVQIVEN